MFPIPRLTTIVATFTLSLLASAIPLHADLLDARMFNTAEYTQTAAGTTFQNYSVEMDVITQSSSATFTSAQVTYPGPGSPAILNPAPGDQFFNTYFGPYSSLTSLHQALPFGNYTTSFTNGTITDSATIDYTTDHFQSAIPTLAPASYAAIQSMDPTQAITLNFNSFTPDPATNAAVGTTVTIFAPNGAVAFTTFVAPNITSVTVPANTLQSDTTYNLNVSQGGRISTPANGEGGCHRIRLRHE